MNKIFCASIQIDCVTRDVETNTQKALLLMEEAKNRGSKLIVLPELFLSGYGLNEDYKTYKTKANKKSPQLKPFAEFSRKYNVVVVGGFVEDVTKGIYNSAFVFDHGELAGVYRKYFLWGEENDHFLKEKENAIIQTSIGKLAVLICYEIGFPEVARDYALTGADLFIVPSAYGKARGYAWDIATCSRALENGISLISSNRIGTDEERFTFAGQSRVVNAQGRILSELHDEEGILYAEVDLDQTEKQRNTIPYLKDLVNWRNVDGQ